MLNKIEALRKESRTKRNRVAFMIASAVTFVIALVWSISLPSRLGNTFEAPTANDENVVPNISDQLSGMRDYLGDTVSSIKSQAELLEVANQTPTSSLESEMHATSSATSSPTTSLETATAPTTSTTTATTTTGF